MKVAIIGAGFTGLTAGYELAKHGISVTIFEKNSDIGGLAGGFTIEGASLEKAYHHLFRTDTDILSLIDELGMHNELGWFPSKIGMVVEKSKSEVLNSEVGQNHFKVLPFNGISGLLTYKPLPFFDRVRAGAVLFFLQKYKHWKSLIGVSAVEWMTKYSGLKVMDAIWGPLLQGKFSRYASKISMAWLWARIHIRANSRKNIFDKELLAYPTRGFISIAEKLAKRIEESEKKQKNEVIRTATNIESITYADGMPQIATEGKVEKFDVILSTIPQKTLETLVVSPVTNDSQIAPRPPIDYLGAVVLAFSSAQSLSEQYWHNIIANDAPFLVFLQHTNLVPKTWYNGKNIYYIGVYLPHDHRFFTDPTCTENSIKNEWFNYLKKLFSDFDPTLVNEAKLFKLPFAQQVVDTEYPSKIQPYQSPFPAIYTANFAQIFPEDRGTNYAVREGRKVAALIMADLLQ